MKTVKDWSFKFFNDTIHVGGGELFLIAGPCVIESEAHALKMAECISGVTRALKVPYIFKASYDKANRTSLSSFRGPGVEEGTRILRKVREQVGVPVLTDKPDIANARINFANGCIANVTSSRVSLKRERKIRFFQPDAYISIDYDQRRAQIFYKPAPGAGWLDIRTESIEIKEGDALADEIDSFLDCVASRNLPLVGGAEGLRALEIASLISSQL